LQLTLFRFVGAPCTLPFLIVYGLPYNVFLVNCLVGLVLLLFGLTDFFDGYLARKYNQTTSYGQVLDPIADKFLLYSTLVALVAVGKLYFLWAIVWIGREFLVMGLRMIAVERDRTIPVSYSGKIKTILQIAALLCVIINPYQYDWNTGFWWNALEASLLVNASIYSIVSLYQYVVLFFESKS